MYGEMSGEAADVCAAHREGAHALAAALVDKPGGLVVDSEHRHNPVRCAVGAGDVRAARADVVQREADAALERHPATS